MNFQTILSTIATIVSIVGGVIGIMSALSKEPVFLRFWQRQASREAPPVVQPAPVLSQPIGEATAPPIVQEQPHQRVPVTRIRVGIVYGLVVSGLSILIIIGIQAIYAQYTSSILVAIPFIGIAMLSIAA